MGGSGQGTAGVAAAEVCELKWLLCLSQRNRKCCLLFLRTGGVGLCGDWRNTSQADITRVSSHTADDSDDEDLLREIVGPKQPGIYVSSNSMRFSRWAGFSGQRAPSGMMKVNALV